MQVRSWYIAPCLHELRALESHKFQRLQAGHDFLIQRSHITTVAVRDVFRLSSRISPEDVTYDNKFRISALPPEVAGSNFHCNIHYSENLRNSFWSGSAISNAALLYVPCKNSHSLSKSMPIALQRISKLKRFHSFFQFWGVKTFLFKIFFCLYSRVLADFTIFTGLLRYMQPLPWEIGSLGCRFH